MARQRRGGFRPPEIRGTLGTLLRTTIEQAGVVRDALERGAREGRSRLDDALAGRRRKDALADLGELVLDLIRRGEIDLAELPEAADLVRHLDELDADEEPSSPPAPDDRRLRRRPADADEERFARAPVRSRFDVRGQDRDEADEYDDRGSRPPDRRAPLSAPPRGRDRDRRDPDRPSRGGDDGTVSALSGTGAGSGPARRAPLKSVTSPRVWRPGPTEDGPPTVPESLRARGLAKDPHHKGGISFDDDDLADYMHPDDVPPKPPTDGET